MTYKEYVDNYYSCKSDFNPPPPPNHWYRVINPQIYRNVDDYYLLQMIRKGHVLKYTNNSSHLTKQQIYSKISNRTWVNSVTYGTQSEVYSNPNTSLYQRNGTINITLNGQQTNLPITCPSNTPIVNPILPTNKSGKGTNVLPTPAVNKNVIFPPIQSTPPPSPPIVIQEGGTLNSSLHVNPCTGETNNGSCNLESIVCFPTSDSDVPGPIINLCYIKTSVDVTIKNSINQLVTSNIKPAFSVKPEYYRYRGDYNEWLKTQK